MSSKTQDDIIHRIHKLANESRTVTLEPGEVGVIVAMYNDLAHVSDERDRLSRMVGALQSVIHDAHHVVVSHDRIWGGTEWVLHPLSTITRGRLRRILEGYDRKPIAARPSGYGKGGE